MIRLFPYTVEHQQLWDLGYFSAGFGAFALWFLVQQRLSEEFWSWIFSNFTNGEYLWVGNLWHNPADFIRL